MNSFKLKICTQGTYPSTDHTIYRLNLMTGKNIMINQMQKKLIHRAIYDMNQTLTRKNSKQTTFVHFK